MGLSGGSQRLDFNDCGLNLNFERKIIKKKSDPCKSNFQVFKRKSKRFFFKLIDKINSSKFPL